MSIKWTREKIDFVVERANSKVPYVDIAEEFEAEFGEPVSPSALHIRVSRARRGIHVPMDSLEPEESIVRFLPEVDSGEELVEKLIEMGKTFRKCDNTEVEAKVRVKPETDWALIVCSGDWHLENQTSMVEKLAEDLELVGNTPGAYYIFMGDETDNHIPGGKHMGGSNEAVLPPKLARLAAKTMFEKLNGKTLAMVSGCHVSWSVNADDYNFIQDLSQEIGCSFMGPGGALELDFGKVKYRFGIRHKPQYNSKINPLHSCRVHLQRLDTTCDVVAMAHHHVTAVCTEYFQGRPVVYLRTGTYKPTDRYIAALGFRKSPCVVPCVLLNTKTKDLRIAGSIKEGIDLLEFLNSK